jgi:hypothetical protein
MEFCYNSTKCSTIGASLFELTLRVEEGQPIDLTISRSRRVRHEGGKNAKQMVEKHIKNSWKNHIQVMKNKLIRFEDTLNSRFVILCG